MAIHIYVTIHSTEHQHIVIDLTCNLTAHFAAENVLDRLKSFMTVLVGSRVTKISRLFTTFSAIECCEVYTKEPLQPGRGGGGGGGGAWEVVFLHES